MENPGNMYCRFCAEPKTVDKLIYLENDEARYNDVLLKLTFVNAYYVDVTKEDALPKTVCLICYDSLNKACDFLDRVKNAQKVLLDLLGQDGFKYFNDEDDKVSTLCDLDFLAQADTGHKVDENIHDYDVKIEELDDQNEDGSILQHVSNCDNEENETQALDVQYILDAALCNGSDRSNVTIYAKELTDIAKKEVNTWKDYPWLCTYCNIECLNLEMLRTHSKVVHNKCATFVCVDCKWFNKDSFDSFLKHARKHRENLRSHCPYCDENFPPNKLKIHHQQHFTDWQVPCGTCGEIFPNKELLKQHVEDYLPNRVKRKPRRKRGAPVTVEELTCDICKKIYKNSNSLRDHMKLHRNDRKRDYTCDRCGKTFFNKGTLTSHIMSHDQIRPHLCKICNKSFLFPNMLRRHVEMHSGVKPFACEQCGRCFRLRYQLNAHKIIHTDEMPYVCQYCNKAFRFKQILKNHERQHTGAKPYSCEYCAMEFSNWSNYNKHMKRRHGIDTSKKKITPAGVFPFNPETGQIIQPQEEVTEEWKSKVMIPGKRGKKKASKITEPGS